MGYVVRMEGMRNAWISLTQYPRVEKTYDIKKCTWEVNVNKTVSVDVT